MQVCDVNGKSRLTPGDGECLQSTGRTCPASATFEESESITYQQLTLSVQGSPASLLATQGSSEARQMTVTSGRMCLELSRKSGPLGCFLRMCLESSTWRSTRCYLAWKPRATKQRRLLSRLVPSVPRIGEIGSGLLPTLTATDAAPITGGELYVTKTGTVRARYKLHSSNRGLLPTLTQHGNYNRVGASPNSGDGLATVLGGNINPEFAEWFMGFPVGWSELPDSETP